MDKLSLMEEEEPIIPLKDGIDLRDLEKGTEFVINKEAFDFESPEERNYYNNEELLKMLNEECLYSNDNETDDDDNNDNDKSPFEKMMKKMVPLVENEIFKKELKKGSGKELPNKAFVTIHYNAYLEYSDEPFDSSRLRGTPLRFVLGENRVIEGLDIGVASMKKGEVSRFLIKSTFAYGEMGCPPRIPPNATIMYEIELLSFVDSAAAVKYEKLTPEEKNQCSFSEMVNVIKAELDAGNDYFKRSNHYKALNKYKKAIRTMENIHAANEEEDNQRNEYLLKLYLNSSLCYILQNQYKSAISNARNALRIDNNNTKANFRCGKALRLLGDFSEAKRYLQKAMRREPQNIEIKNELKILAEKEAKYLAFEKKFCKGIFKTSLNENDDNENPSFKYKVNEEFKACVKECMQKLLNDDELQEIPFSSGFAPSEISCIKQVAKELGLFFIEQKNGQNKQIKVRKTKL